MIVLEIILEFLFGWVFDLISGGSRKKKRLTKRDIARAERAPWRRR